MSEKQDHSPPMDDDADREQDVRMHCPKCHSTDIRRARVSGLWSTLSSFMGRKPYRCRSCRVKFYRFYAPESED